jgi:ABC-2 type transport system permease protein
MSIFHNIADAISDTAFIWRQEMRQVLRDEGVLIFFIIVPLVYPLLYSWIYNNEVVRDVPVVVVDDNNSSLSRQFTRMADASADVKVLCHAADIDEAKSLVSRQLAKGIYYIPSDFDSNIYGMRQATISVYCDMSLMLTYQAIYQTAVSVTQTMGAGIQVSRTNPVTKREAEISVQPLAVSEVPIFNPAGGYGSSILLAVLMLILQQTLVLGIGLSAGTARENNRYHELIPIDGHYQGIFRIIGGKFFCYFMIYAVMGAYLTMAVPHFFSFPQLAQWKDLLLLMLPYVLACIFFGMIVSCVVRYRENVMLLMVFVSVPLLFLTGISWPHQSIPPFWQSISWLFPSTFGVRAYVRMNTMGATLSDVMFEYRLIWLQALLYFLVACIVYRHQILLSRRHALEQLDRIGRKIEVVAQIRKRKKNRNLGI